MNFTAFKKAARIRGDHPAMLAELEDLYERDQALSAGAVVREARPKSSALHDHFEWNNRVAAEAYRLRQAGDLIRAIVTVTVDEATQQERQIRALVSVSADDTTGASEEEAPDEHAPTRVYIKTSALADRPDLAHEVMRDIARDIATFTRKYEHIQELSAVREAMAEFRDLFLDPEAQMPRAALVQ